MSKDPKPAPEQQRYEDVVARLEEVVKRLEGGQLTLEDSLRAFEDGVRLVQRGEKLLGDAEQRIEQLLHEDGGDKAVPLNLPANGQAQQGAPAPARKQAPGAPAAPKGDDDEDVPF